MKGDLNKDGKMSSYEKKRSMAIEKAMMKKGGTKKKKMTKKKMSKKDMMKMKMMKKGGKLKMVKGPDGN